jgi:hypothetical protein
MKALRRHNSKISVLTLLGMTLILGVPWCDGAVAASDGPHFELIWPEKAAYVHRPFVGVIEGTWSGATDDFLIFPTEIPALDWATARVTATHVFSDQGTAKIRQTVEITPTQPGNFEIPALVVRYMAGAASEVDETQTTVFSFPATSLVVSDAPSGQWGLYGIGGIAVIAVLVGWYLGRRRRDRVSEPVESPYTHVQRLLHLARRHRLDGHYYDLYQELHRVALQLKDIEGGAVLAEKFGHRVQEVGFQGVRPKDEEMDSDFREIERAVSRWKEGLQT